MALAYLPAAEIPAAITSLNLPERFRLYLQETWLTTWTPDSWSVYRQGVGINNDCEKWHRRFNGIVANRGAPDLYSLINLLGSIVSAQIKLVSIEKMRKRQRINDNGRWKLWDCYDLKNITTSELLRKARKFSSIL